MSEASCEIVIALYKPHAGKEAELRALVDRHLPTLRRLEFVTERPGLLAQSSDGTLVEIFEWRPGAAALAHEHPAVGEVWEAMAALADFNTLASLPEATRRFPHFRPL